MTKQRNENLKYEDMDLNTTDKYAFTYAPSDQHQFWGELERFELFKKKMYSYFTSILKEATITFRIEVSPHGRLHLHGFIMIRNKMDFYLYGVPKLEQYGNICIKALDETDEWYQYCEKQQIDEWHTIPIVYKPLNKRNKRGIRVVSPSTQGKENPLP